MRSKTYILARPIFLAIARSVLNIQRPALSVALSREFRRAAGGGRHMADASSTEKGAAEEPEPEPGEPPSTTTTTTAAAATYDPREYQPAHPDDRGGGGKKATKGKGKGKGKGKAKSDNAGANAKAKDCVGLDRCGNCDAEGALRACKQCGAKAYCSESCQRVSVVSA